VTGQLRVLQRVIMPIDRGPDVRKLYVDAESGSGVVLDNGAGVAHRRGMALPPGGQASLCTYFNAFPAGYWRRWTTVDEVRLRVRLQGTANVAVYRSTSKGDVCRVDSVEIDSDTGAEHEFVLSLRPFLDGGWYWFDLAADTGGAVLDSAEWCAVVPEATPRGRTSIGITTYNRPDFCVKNLIALGADAEGLELVDEIFVVDQGTQRVEEHPDFERAAKTLAGRLHVIDQGNLGGSGGFARAMYETVGSGNSDYLLVLDDDVVTEPEGIVRAVTFADLTRRTTIVGGHMFSLYNRSVLQVYGETVAPHRWHYQPAPQTISCHDLAEKDQGLRETDWLQRCVNVDYNAWWMCLIPTAVIREIGLPMPMFIKWDDLEFGIRARDAGYPTTTLPGVAVWHMPWHEKDDTIDWQAYYHERGRLVSAFLHQPRKRGGNVIKESLLVSIRHMLAMRYSPAELMLMAIKDVLGGPGHMHPSLIEKTPEIRAFRQGFPDAQGRDDLGEFPAPRPAKPLRDVCELGLPAENRRYQFPVRIKLIKIAAISAITHALPVRRAARERPAAIVPHVDQRWWRLARLDSALVSSADGTQAFWYRRDPRRFRSLLLRSVALHVRLVVRWPKLKRRYQEALPQVTSRELWRRTFEASGSGRSGRA
jgi:galactofuranosylgalactofuranosylrhamnosyl-N-acetylglucosaminyl-diphospho-decaprenol beta-1,5/1,6-galactofuranosyltransferase